MAKFRFNLQDVEFVKGKENDAFGNTKIRC